MADARLYFSNPNIPKTFGQLVVSVWENESHDRSNNVTNYPVENGTEISDHIQPQPIELNVSGIVEATDTGTNIIDSYFLLKQIMEEKQIITVVTSLDVYENMCVLSSNVTRNAQNGGSLSFTATLKQITYVSSQAIAIPNGILNDNNKQSQAKQDLGKATSGQSQSTNQEQENFSFLSQIDAQLDTIFGVVQK